MESRVEDRLVIADLMTGWMHRDLGEWDRLRSLFQPDGTIEITWFEGPAGEFVDASAKMGASDLRTKHLVASPVITFNGERALVETNAMIVAENTSINLGCTTHNRFWDRVEKRDGRWGIVHRQCIYDMSFFTFPTGTAEIHQAAVARYPREYAALAYLLDKSGFPVGRVFATRGSEQEREMKEAGAQWLASEPQ